MRPAPVAALALAALAAWPATAASPPLTSRNSILLGLRLIDKAEIAGVGCGTSASRTVPLRASVQDVRVLKPKVGDTAGTARVTAVALEEGVVRITAVGDSPATCAPEEDPSTPPAERSWRGMFDFEAQYNLRVQVKARVDTDRGTTGKLAVRPKKVHIPFISTLVGIRWKSFGGRTAEGVGTLHNQLPDGKRCRARMCIGDGDRFRVKAYRPSTCRDLPPGTAYYGVVAFITTRKEGVIRPGRLFQSDQPSCYSGGPFPAKPVPR
jgi:hypothetical protein